MNERIKEMFIRANGRISLDPNGCPYQFYQDELEKFAELIVEECASLAYEGPNGILDHFSIINMRPCPFCGKEANLKDGDTLYPNGTGWDIQDNGMRTYHTFREVPEEQWCWSMHCPTTAGGCGVEMSGDTKDECIDKWNKRT